jgi:hypothetical protein
MLAIAAATAAIGIYVIGPTFLMANPKQRRERLVRLAPRTQDPSALSPGAARLRGHVVALANAIGERRYGPMPRASVSYLKSGKMSRWSSGGA